MSIPLGTRRSSARSRMVSAAAITKLLAGAAAAVLLVGLSGCSLFPAPAISLAGSGTVFCAPLSAKAPAGVAVPFHNTTGQTITVTGVSFSGVNITAGSSYILRSSSESAKTVYYTSAPVSGMPGWSTRTRVGSADVGAGKWAIIGVTYTFLDGHPAGTTFDGFTMSYRTADGASGTSRSGAKAKYGASC